MPSGSKKRKSAAKKKQQKGGGGLHISSASSQNPSPPGTGDLKLHVEMGSDSGFKWSHDGESDGDSGDVSSPPLQDHPQLHPPRGEQEDEEENKKGGRPPLQTFVDDNESSGDVSAVDEVTEGLKLENKLLDESNEGGRLGDDEGESSLTSENEVNNLASEAASPKDSLRKQQSECAYSAKDSDTDSVKESHDEEVRDFTLDSVSPEDSVEKEESKVKSEYADSLKELRDGQILGNDQSISIGNLGFEVTEEQAHGFELEPASLDHSVKRKESCNGNGEHADSVHVGALVDDEHFRIGVADNEVKAAYDFTSEFVSLDNSFKTEMNRSTYSGYVDSAKEIHGGTVGDDVVASIGNLEHDVNKEEAHAFTSETTFINDSVKKEVRDVESLYVQSVMEAHNGGTLGVTRNSDIQERNEEARDFTSKPELLYDSVNFGDSVFKQVSQVIGSTVTAEACNLIGNPTSMADSIKLARYLPEDPNCSSETASTDDHFASGAVTLGLKENENFLSGVLPLLDEDGRVSSGASGISFAWKKNEDKPLCPSDHSSVPNVETAIVADNIKDSEETLECSEQQPLVNSAPPPVKASWKSCCGLFGVLTGSV